MSIVETPLHRTVLETSGLRTEKEIMSTWKGDINHPLVSILCITYNHASFIEDAIKGFLIQETEFPFEIWIHDDASQDGTKDIVEAYRVKYPRIISVILQDENQYSRGGSGTTLLMSRCKGDFVAYCEGDDYWISPWKLKWQVEMLIQHPELDMCLHSARCKDLQNGDEKLLGCYGDFDGHVIPAEHIIEKKYGQVPTASTMVRRTIYKEMMGFFEKFPRRVVGDIYLHYFGSKRGGAVFINDAMCCYRINVPGSFTARYAVDFNLRLSHIESRIRSYNALAKMEYGRFDKSFRISNRHFVRSFLLNPYNPAALRRKVLHENRDLFDFKEKAMLAIYFIFTPLFRLVKKTRSRVRRLSLRLGQAPAKSSQKQLANSALKYFNAQKARNKTKE